MVASVIEVGGTPRGSVVRQLARQAVRQRPPEPAGMDRRRRTLQNTTGGLGPENPLFRVAHDRIVARCVVAASSHSSPLGAGRAGAGSRREPWIPRGASPRVRRTQLAQARDPGVERAGTCGLSSPPQSSAHACAHACMHARVHRGRLYAFAQFHQRSCRVRRVAAEAAFVGMVLRRGWRQAEGSASLEDSVGAAWVVPVG